MKEFFATPRHGWELTGFITACAVIFFLILFVIHLTPSSFKKRMTIVLTFVAGLYYLLEFLIPAETHIGSRVVTNPLVFARYRDEFYRLSRSITGATRSGAAAPLTTIGNMIDEDKAGEAYGETGDHTWIIVRDPVTGVIIMQFAIDYTAVRDLNLDAATSITASAPGDIEIIEITGDMGVNVIEAGGKVCTLPLPISASRKSPLTNQ